MTMHATIYFKCRLSSTPHVFIGLTMFFGCGIMIGKSRKDDIKISFQRVRYRKFRPEPDVLNFSLNTSADLKETPTRTASQYSHTSPKSSKEMTETKFEGAGSR